MTGVSTPAYACPVVNASTIQCTGSYVAATASVQLRLAATANGVAMALKQFDPSKGTMRVRELPLAAWQPAAAALTRPFNANDDTLTLGAGATAAAPPPSNHPLEATA